MIMAAIMVMGGCGTTTPPVPQPVPRQIILTWTPGQCTEIYKIYMITATKEIIGTTNAPTWTTTMVPVKSQWQVSGSCGQDEYVSDIVELVP